MCHFYFVYIYTTFYEIHCKKNAAINGKYKKSW